MLHSMGCQTEPKKPCTIPGCVHVEERTTFAEAVKALYEISYDLLDEHRNEHLPPDECVRVSPPDYLGEYSVQVELGSEPFNAVANLNLVRFSDSQESLIESAPGPSVDFVAAVEKLAPEDEQRAIEALMQLQEQGVHFSRSYLESLRMRDYADEMRAALGASAVPKAEAPLFEPWGVFKGPPGG